MKPAITDYVHATGAINLGLSDTAAIRGAFNVVNRDGYLSNGADDDVEQAARLRFQWEPATAVTLQLSADYSHMGGKGSDYVYLPQRPGAALRKPSPMPRPTYTCMPSARSEDSSMTSSTTTANKTLINVSAQLDWKLGGFAILTVLPAYRHVEAQYRDSFRRTIHR